MKTKIAVLLIALGLASPAFSQPAIVTATHSRWYGTIGLGYAKTANIISENDLHNYLIQGFGITYCNCTYGGSDSDHDFSWKLAVGYRLSRFFRVEAFYTDFGNIKAKASFSGSALLLGYPFTGTSKLDYTVGTWASGLAVTAGYPITNHFRAYAKLGWFYSKTDTTVKESITDTYFVPTYSYSVSAKDSSDGSGSLAGLGASFSIGTNYVIALEWNRYNHIKALNQTTNIDVIDGNFRYYF